MGNDQRQFIQLLNDIRHRKSLAGSDNVQKGLTLVIFLKVLLQLLNDLGLFTS